VSKAANGPGRTRRVPVRLWSEAWFTGLCRPCRLLALYLLAGPQTNRCGLYQFSPGQAAEDLGCAVGDVTTWLRCVVAATGGRWQLDDSTRVVWISDWFEKYDALRGLSALLDALRDREEVPQNDCDAAFDVITDQLRDALSTSRLGSPTR
jgi:hypothetical protein